MDYHQIHQQVVDWMIDRGWREVYGKKGAFTQSLLQHTDVELNVLLELLPVLSRPEHYNLTDAEQQALIVGQVVHDVGKETEAWQHYVKAPREQQRSSFVPHVIRPLTNEAVADLVNVLGFPEYVIADATKFVNLHMAATRNVTNTLNAVLLGKGASNRWNVLARIVDVIDNICSVPTLLQTLQVIEDDQQRGGVVGPHIRLAYHLINVRGVSSAMLHRASEKAYRANSWSPILYFGNGTIYVADGLADIAEPTPEQIIESMAGEIQLAVPNNSFSKMVVGKPSETFLPKPDFFDYHESEAYLRQASRKVNRGSFRKKPLAKRRDVVENLMRLQGSERNPSDLDVDITSERIDVAQPEMLVFKFFKAAVDPLVAGKNGAFATSAKLMALETELTGPNLSDKDRKRINKAINKLVNDTRNAWCEQVSDKYESVFGQGSFDALQSTSTLMPAKEMASVIEPFWSLPGNIFNVSVEQIGLAPEDVRMSALIQVLVNLIGEVYELLPEDVRPTRATPTQIATAFSEDLIHPSSIDIECLAKQQAASYASSKTSAFTEGTVDHICPVCNKPFMNGALAKADFLDKPESHTNRAVAHGATGSIIICDACKYERFLQQLLLGEHVARVLVVVPRNHIGRWSGEVLVQQVENFREDAQNLMSNDTNDPNKNVTFALTSVIAKNLAIDQQSDRLSLALQRGLDGRVLARTFSYQMVEDKRKEHRKALSTALRKEYELTDDTDVESLNDEWGTNFSNWDSMLDAVIKGDIKNDVVYDIRAEAYRLQPQMKIVCETPNVILVPLRNGFSVGKESDTNAALRELFTLLLIGIALDCSVVAIDIGDPIEFLGGEGVARVPPIPAIRDLVGNDWVGLDKAGIWLEKIGAASLLANATSYPERSNLYQILSAITRGHVLRRIEMKSEAGQASLQQIQLIQKALQDG